MEKEFKFDKQWHFSVLQTSVSESLQREAAKKQAMKQVGNEKSKCILPSVLVPSTESKQNQPVEWRYSFLTMCRMFLTVYRLQTLCILKEDTIGSSRL